MHRALWNCAAEALLETLYPPVCLLCGAPGQAGMDLCPDCAGELPVPQAACRCCARPLPANAGPVCGACLRRPPAFDTARAAYQQVGHGEQWRCHHQGGSCGYNPRDVKAAPGETTEALADQA
ncbi:MAG: double zinc ribbon domain-containing protein, partial [Ectothiorhodospira sp.]